ncbi:hypothetical protein JTB14_009547 [Gonioctena quinquepunctata]|nr:hypothetical protein JTB14_009547 [Gonioctena quinquepunctata]
MEIQPESNKIKSEPIPNRQKLMGYFGEYCDYTGIHGFRYIGENRTILEKLWWIISLVLSVALCGLMIYEIFQKYIHYPGKNFTRLFEFTDLIGRMDQHLPVTIEEEKQLNLASTICDFQSRDTTSNITKEEDFHDFLKKSRTSFLEYCQYLGKIVECNDIFTPIVTEEGICYSYNILDKNDIFRENTKFIFSEFHKTQPTKHWNVEEGYTDRDIETYPKRALRTGAKNSLVVELNVKISDLEYECPSDESGYRVTLHSPYNIPNVPDYFFTVPLKQKVIGTIIPEVIKTSTDVKMFEASKRDCFFQSDRRLKFFRIYSQGNCLLECKTDFVLSVCGCVGFHMPRVPGTPICLLEKIECLERAEDEFMMFNGNHEITGNKNDCECRPTCTYISYGIQLSYNNLKWLPANKTLRKYLDEKHHQYSALTLYFKNNHFETKERNVLYGFSDFISNFGGLLGLFTGFSILSFMEIIYFFSLRLWGNYQLYGNWSGQKNQ